MATAQSSQSMATLQRHQPADITLKASSECHLATPLCFWLLLDAAGTLGDPDAILLVVIVRWHRLPLLKLSGSP